MLGYKKVIAFVVISVSFFFCTGFTGGAWDSGGGGTFSGGALTSDTSLADDIALSFGNSTDYWQEYDSAGTKLCLHTTNADGGGTDGTVFCISNGTDDITLYGDSFYAPKWIYHKDDSDSYLGWANTDWFRALAGGITILDAQETTVDRIGLGGNIGTDGPDWQIVGVGGNLFTMLGETGSKDAVSNCTLTDSSAAITAVGEFASGYSAGDMIYIYSAADAGNIGAYRIVSVDSNDQITVDRAMTVASSPDSTADFYQYTNAVVVLPSDGTNGLHIKGISEYDKPLQIGGDVLNATTGAGAEDVAIGKDLYIDGFIYGNGGVNAPFLTMNQGNYITISGSGVFFQTLGDLLAGDALYTANSGSGKELTDTNGQQSGFEVQQAVNQSGTAAYDGIFVDITENGVGDGSTGSGNNLFRGAVGGADKFKVSNTGVILGLGSYSTDLNGLTFRDAQIKDDGTIGYDSSSIRGKGDVTLLTDTSWLYDLRPVRYRSKIKGKDGKYTDDLRGEYQYGLIAEEVAEINPKVAFYDKKMTDEGETLVPAGVHYNKMLIIPMLAEMQNLKKELDAEKAAKAELENRVERLESLVQQLMDKVGGSYVSGGTGDSHN